MKQVESSLNLDLDLSLPHSLRPCLRMGVPETFITDQQGVMREMGIGPRAWMSLDSLQILTRWFTVTSKAAAAQQSDREASKG